MRYEFAQFWCFGIHIVILAVHLARSHPHLASKLLEDLVMRCAIEETPISSTTFSKQNANRYCWTPSLAPHAVKAIYLHVLTTNSAAVRFYEKSRFTRLRTVPYFYEIDNESHDSYLYIFYLNDGHPPSLPYLFITYVVQPCRMCHSAY